jgi:hypothetical protein
MKRIKALGLILISLPSAFAYQVQVTFDNAIHFSCYKTYRLKHSTGDQSPQAVFPIALRQRIAGVVEERLTAKGLKPVASGGDLLISYSIHLTEHTQNINLSDGVGPTGLGSGDAVYIATLRTIREWTLVVSMVDAKQDHLVFEGKLNEAISSIPEKNAKRLVKAADKILEKYPPLFQR